MNSKYVNKESFFFVVDSDSESDRTQTLLCEYS
jgi:hypothetical protein